MGVRSTHRDFYSKDFLLEMRKEADIIALAVKRSDKARQKRAHATASLIAPIQPPRSHS
jgi:hypothetical protein